MALDHTQFDALLADALTHAERAVSENDPQLYRQAFIASIQAMRLLADESGAWRQMVARATEEYQGDEGI